MEGQEIFEWVIRSSFAIAVVGFVLFFAGIHLAPKIRFNLWLGTLILMAGLIFAMNSMPEWQILRMRSVDSVASPPSFDAGEKVSIKKTDAREISSLNLNNVHPRVSMSWWMIIWIGGIILFVGRLVTSFFFLTRKNRPIEGDHVGLALCETLRSEIGVLSPVQLVEGEGSAMTWGIFRPRIALPKESAEWPLEHLEMVIRHELAHLKRRDPLWLALSQLVAALTWFHPGMWIIINRLGIEREKATDESVLDQGIRPSSYASAILNLSIPSAQSKIGIPSVAICGMATPKSKSEIEERIKRVIASDHHRPGKFRMFLPVALSALIIGGGALSFVVAIFQDINDSISPNITVAIDAGHGAHDIGVKREGVVEKDLNLDIAKRIEKKLHKSGITVVMTRSDDRYLPLSERKEIANQSEAVLMVSIHCNSDRKGKSKGIECYTGGLISEANDQSVQLGKALLAHTVAETATEENRLITGSQLFLFRSRTLPTALIECGYVTHPEEREKLANPEYREKLATGISKGVIAFLATNPKRLDRYTDQKVINEKLIISKEKQKALKAKLEEITIPSIEFINTPIGDVVTFLKLRSVELDSKTTAPSKKGINIILPSEDIRKTDISMKMKNASLSQILKNTAELAGGRMIILDSAVLIVKPMIIPAASVSGTDEKGLIANNVKKLESIILPKVDFEKAPLTDVLTFLQQQSVELDLMEKDPQKRGITITFPTKQSEPPPEITLKLSNVPLAIALKYVCQLAHHKYKVEPYNILIEPVIPLPQRKTKK